MWCFLTSFDFYLMIALWTAPYGRRSVGLVRDRVPFIGLHSLTVVALFRAA